MLCSHVLQHYHVLLQAFMGNPQLQARMQSLKDDPEFADFFKEIQTGGMQVRLWRDLISKTNTCSTAFNMMLGA